MAKNIEIEATLVLSSDNLQIKLELSDAQIQQLWEKILEKDITLRIRAINAMYDLIKKYANEIKEQTD